MNNEQSAFDKFLFRVGIIPTLLIGCMVHSCISEASAQPRVSYAKGWPIMLKGGDWDSGLASDRIGIGYVMKVGKTALSADGVTISFTTGPSILFGEMMKEYLIGWTLQPKVTFMF